MPGCSAQGSRYLGDPAIQRLHSPGDITWISGVGYVDLNIPRVHVSMEKVVLKHLGKECFDAFMSQYLKSTLAARKVPLADWHAVDALHDQQVAAGMFAVNSRHI